MRVLILGAALLLPIAQARADVAVILTDPERAALLELINEAVKAKGLDAAPNAVYLANKIKTAGTVTERKDQPKDNPQ